MSGNARGNRRRRVLSDEMRFGSSLGIAVVDAPSDPAPRYGESALLENHPAVSDLVPRRKRTFFLMLTLVGMCGGAAEFATRQAEQLASAVPGATADQIATCAAGLLNWTGALCVLATAAAARMVYALRRHCVDDQRGRYRVWKRVAIASLGVSLVAATGVHHALADVLSAATGITLLAGGCGWWLIPAGLLGCWFAWRMTADLGPCRGGVTLLILASLAYVAAALSVAGLLPTTWGEWPATVGRLAPLAGHALGLAALATFARYVILDVQGLVEYREPRQAKPKRAKPAKTTPADGERSAAPAQSPEAQTTVALQSAARGEDTTRLQWEVDEDEDEDDGRPARRLSKAEKKKLRQQQRDNRRAA